MVACIERLQDRETETGTNTQSDIPTQTANATHAKSAETKETKVSLTSDESTPQWQCDG